MEWFEKFFEGFFKKVEGKNTILLITIFFALIEVLKVMTKEVGLLRNGIFLNIIPVVWKLFGGK